MTQTQTQEETRLIIPMKTYMQGKEFYNAKMNLALEDSQKDGYNPIFMPQLIDAKNEASNDSEIWSKWYTTPSIRATGIPKKGKYSGKPIVVYAHLPNALAQPDHIKFELEAGFKRTGRISQDEFQGLVDSEGTTDSGGNTLVYVISHQELKKSESGLIAINKALKHPQTIPFVGGEDRAKRYLERVAEVYDTKQIGIWHSDDLAEQPMGRLLHFGNFYYYGDLGAGRYLDDSARFVGVRNVAQKIVPSLEQVLSILDEHVSKVSRPEVEARLKPLFNK